MMVRFPLWRRTAVLVPLIGCLAPRVEGQAAKTLWDTPDDLMEWVAYPNGLEPDQPAPFEKRTEGDRDYVHLRTGESYPLVFFARPGGDWRGSFHLSSLKTLPVVLQPATHNAVRVVLRHGGTGLDLFTGVWAHRTYEYDDAPVDLPTFANHDSPDDGTWHEIILKLTESPLLKVDDDVVYVHLALFSMEWRSLDEGATAWTTFPDSSYLDVDQVELVKVDEAIPAPTITDFYPKRGRWGTEVTIEGSGFGDPAHRNIVRFEDAELRILSGSPTRLVVAVAGGDSDRFTVVTPGGQSATSEESFDIVGEPREFISQDGDDQQAVVGTTLQPFVVKVLDSSAETVPGERVWFSVVSGGGTISASEVLTDDDGLASTVLTLGMTPGTVRVQAEVEGFRPRIFTAVAVAP
jgi:hypothetical protein